MEGFTLHLAGDNAWPDLQEKGFTAGEITSVAALEKGTALGLPAVMFRIELPDGKVVLAQTTLRLFLAAASSMRARFGER